MPNNPAYDVQLVRSDMDDRGWIATDLAKHAELTDQTISRLLKGQATVRTLKKVAFALRGHATPRRYLKKSGVAA